MLEFSKISDMVLVTPKERRQGYTSSLGTIFYKYEGQQHSVRPGEPLYNALKTHYDYWKKDQADRERRQRDQAALGKLVTHMAKVKQKSERIRFDLPGDPLARAFLDDLTIPLRGHYEAEATEQDVTARVTLQPYSHRYGCYTLQAFYGKVIPGGTLGSRQGQRARHLRDRLIAFVKTQLHEAGWRVVPDEPGEHWRWEGQTAVEQEKHLAELALKTWRGRAQREGNEKVIRLADDSPVLQDAHPGQWQQVPGHTLLEYLVDPEELQLRVRRRHLIPEKQQERAPASQVIEIVGDAAAHQRGATPAYQRTIHTRPVTFTCTGCRQTVTQQLFPGPTPRYCSETCREEARRQQTLERVRLLRDRRRIIDQHSAKGILPKA